MNQRSRQRHEILHDRPVTQLFDLNCLKVHAGGRESKCDGIDVRACRNENRNPAVARLLQRIAHDGDHLRRLDVLIGVDEPVDVHAAASVCDRRRARTVLNGALLRIVTRGQHCGERVVDPLNDGLHRAEVGFQPQRLQPQIAQPVLLQVDEQSDLGLAETIDRLHRVADAEQRAAVAIGPAAGQSFQQIELTERTCPGIRRPGCAAADSRTPARGRSAPQAYRVHAALAARSRHSPALPCA